MAGGILGAHLRLRVPVAPVALGGSARFRLARSQTRGLEFWGKVSSISGDWLAGARLSVADKDGFPAERKDRMKRVRIQLLAVFFVWVFPAGAYAYVDPGSGMLFFQGIVAAIGVLLAVVRHPWVAIKRMAGFLASKLRR